MSTKIFDRVYVINLEHRQERLKSFFESLPVDWPFQYPERREAVAGDRSPPPRWWKGGNGAWGCYRTHLGIIEECLNQDIGSVLIFEDDAICVKNFHEKVEQFFAHIPEDWEMVYLGGQHIQQNQRLPRKLNEWVYRPFNVNRSHCYGIRGRKMLELVYRHLNDFRNWNVPHHIDHYLGELHKDMETGLYVPREWLVAQSEGTSDISSNPQEYRLFCGAEELIYPKIDQTGIAILGDWFGGINMISGVLFSLGLHSGADEKQQSSSNTPFLFEDNRLNELCHQSYDKQWLNEKLPYEDRVNHLRHWAGIQCQNQNKNGYFYGNHPILSLMGRELQEAWQNSLFLVIDCPQNISMQIMTQSKFRWNPDTFERALAILRQSRNYFLSSYQPRHLDISYHELKTQPKITIETICDFLRINPTSEEYRNAVDLIRESPDNSVIFLP